MLVDIKVPTPGESVTEVELTNWLVTDGDIVEKDQELAEIESDKATLSLLAADAGKIKIHIEGGETVKVGAVACSIDTSFAGEKVIDSVAPAEEKSEKVVSKETRSEPVTEKKEVIEATPEGVKVSPVAREIMKEQQLNVDDIIKGLKRITSKEVNLVLDQSTSGEEAQQQTLLNKAELSRQENRQKMTQLRKKLSQRLVAVKNETAMLTTFNEVDMSALMGLRKKHQVAFMEKHQVKLGFMSFFLKAASLALQHHPRVNAMIDGDEIVMPDYTDLSVAVQTPKGLMVPVIRNVETLSLAAIELKLKELAGKARKGNISLEEMTGGTFTITNGGVFGSMLSTPIINPPQSAILGMHNIVERPVAINGKVEIRPMMYVALSYDHRIIDGKDSVGFLVKVKEMIENPLQLIVGGHDPEKVVLDL